MRTRPTRGGYSIQLPVASYVKTAGQGLAAAVAVISLVAAGPAAAEWDGSTGQRVLTTGMDIAIVRPLAALRAGLGAILLVPASILASPACIAKLFSREDCRPVYEAPYEVLVAEPADYAFNRKMGEL